MDRVHVIDNPLAKYYLTLLRDKNTRPDKFREYMRILGNYMGFEISRLLDWQETSVETPLSRAKGVKPRGKLLIVAILGASIPMAIGLLEALPWAGLGLVAARRIEENNGVRIEVYYKRLPKELTNYTTIVTDPMLATGKTMDVVLSLLEESGVKKIIVGTIISSKPGIEYITARHPNVDIVTYAIDPILNDKWFIVPGLGDAGDRSLGVVF